jgi:hypothetical protein
VATGLTVFVMAGWYAFSRKTEVELKQAMEFKSSEIMNLPDIPDKNTFEMQTYHSGRQNHRKGLRPTAKENGEGAQDAAARPPYPGTLETIMPNPIERKRRALSESNNLATAWSPYFVDSEQAVCPCCARTVSKLHGT